MQYETLINLIEEIAPHAEFKGVDNSGVQIHTGKKEIERVLVCLEINKAVLEEAVEKQTDMILTHHPLIFTPLYNICQEDFPGDYILKLIRQGISVYSAHLSFDFAPGGNNDYVAELLGIKPEEEGSMEKGYYGRLPRVMNLTEICCHVEQCLNLPKGYLRVVDGERESLKTVGYCTGAGGSYLMEAADRGCDLFITGDVKLHEAQYAKAKGMTVIDAGHYGTEKIFVPDMAGQLRAKAAGHSLELEVLEAKANTNPYTL